MTPLEEAVYTFGFVQGTFVGWVMFLTLLGWATYGFVTVTRSVLAYVDERRERSRS